jgi:hypothetical protein
MDIDTKKLSELAKTLTDDQRRLLREGLAGGGELDPQTLAASLRALDTKAIFERLAAGRASLNQRPDVSAAPLKFQPARAGTGMASQGKPVIVKVDRASATLEDVRRIVKERSDGDLKRVSKLRVLNLDPSEVNDANLLKLASQELTADSASAHRSITIEKPSMSTSIAEIGGIQESKTGVVERKADVVVVIVLGPIVIIIIFEPPEEPPEEPPLTRW